MSSLNGNIQELIQRHRPGFSLEQPFYRDPAIFEHDLERIVLRQWQFAGHEARIPNPGDYFLLTSANESIIIVRGQDGNVNALANVCRHRGSRVALENEGNVKCFSCPYHSWTYTTEGKLISAKTMPEDFDKSAYSLRSCPVRCVEGLIYFNLSDDPVEFDDVAEEVAEYFARYDLRRTKIARRSVWQVHANWKLVWENFQECYHCGPTHPEYCSVMAHALPDSIGSERTKRAYYEYVELWTADMKERGLPFESRVRNNEGRIHTLCRHAIKPGFLTQSPDGQPIAPLLGDIKEYDGGMTAFSIYPAHFVSVLSDHAIAFRFTPQEPELTEVELTWLVREDAVEGRDYDIEKLTWVWKMTTDQDKKIVDDNQAGVNSRFYQPGPYADCEQGVKHFINWYLGQVAEAG